MPRNITKLRRGTPREFPRSLALALFYVLLGIASLTAESSMAPAYLESKRAFVEHASKQDCTSCHQQHLPMTAMGLARQFRAQVDPAAERALIDLVREGEIKEPEVDWQPLLTRIMPTPVRLTSHGG